MGRLKDFKTYLEERRNTVAKIEQSLTQLQEKYESYFSEVSRVQENEFGQLRDHILADREKLPADFLEPLDQARAEAQRDFMAKLKELKQQHEALVKSAERQREISKKAEDSIRQKNRDLDRNEEELKTRNQKLLADIAEFNRRIKEMGRGFGFFSNLFRMRKLQKLKNQLDQEQADIAARIDRIRKLWEEKEQEYTENETDLQKRWVNLATEAAALQTKIDHLETAGLRIVQRSAIEKILYTRRPDQAEPQTDDPACPQCNQKNPKSNHFCHICAHRLTPDRPDFEGSLKEIAELNLHHQRFSEGMKACQEIIALVRGLKSGIDAFTESVNDMISSENRYPLPKLSIEVPEQSQSYGRNFDRLLEAVGKDLSVHPKIFARHIQALIAEVYTEDKIKEYFETMGEELSRQADAQW